MINHELNVCREKFRVKKSKMTDVRKSGEKRRVVRAGEVKVPKRMPISLLVCFFQPRSRI